MKKKEPGARTRGMRVAACVPPLVDRSSRSDLKSFHPSSFPQSGWKAAAPEERGKTPLSIQRGFACLAFDLCPASLSLLSALFCVLFPRGNRPIWHMKISKESSHTWRLSRIAARILERKEQGKLCPRDIRLAGILVSNPAVSNRLIEQACWQLIGRRASRTNV